jgi:hypothetical protein
MGMAAVTKVSLSCALQVATNSSIFKVMTGRHRMRIVADGVK